LSTSSLLYNSLRYSRTLPCTWLTVSILMRFVFKRSRRIKIVYSTYKVHLPLDLRICQYNRTKERDSFIGEKRRGLLMSQPFCTWWGKKMSWYQLTMHANYKCQLSIDSSLSVHNEIRDDPELPDDSGKGTQTKRNGWQFDSRPWNCLSTWRKTSQVAKCLLYMCSKKIKF
jgi:hypothetical protein